MELKKYTSIKIGGRAEHFFEADTIKDLAIIISDVGEDFYLLGAGSNLLITDTLIKKPVIKLGQNFIFIRQNREFIEAGAATRLSSLIKYCLKNNLGGLENLVGIPAAVGGLVAMNASSSGKAVSSYLEEVDVMDYQGNIKTLRKDEIDFGYRTSSLEGLIILKARFKLLKAENLKQKTADLIKQKIQAQDFEFRSFGCAFKNPKNNSAGKLIDSRGFKGLRKGDAQVSLRHANFIINTGSAKYNDVDYLLKKIKDQIYKKYSIILEEEIKRWI